jgi:glycosyltransferase involved in cell wall biosynthesis
MSNLLNDENQLQVVAACPGMTGIFEQGLALQEKGILGALALDYYFDLASAPYKWLPENNLKRYMRKYYSPTLSTSKIHTYPFYTTFVRGLNRLIKDSQSRNKLVYWHNGKFDSWVANGALEAGNLAFGYESTSIHTFQKAKKLNIPCVLYQPIACAEKAVELLEEEKRLFPKLADTLRYNWFPEEEIINKKEERRLADAIICASSFTKKSLVEQGVEEKKIFVEPYGVDQDLFSPSKEKFENFSVIWASSYTQTKGIGYLLEALARKPVPKMQFVLAGYPFGSDPVTWYEDKIQVKRVGKVTNQEIGQIMRKCHVHVFPTLLEGFGRNLIEAMASGLPVITTPNCAGPDLIEDGVTGFIVPIRNVEAICEKLLWIYKHPEEALEMGRKAKERVASLTKADYRHRFAERIHSIWKNLLCLP